MAVTTLKGHVSRALDFYNKGEIFFGLGRTSAWENENKPPTPVNTDDLEEIAGFKLVESKFLVIPVTDSESTSYQISYRDTKWNIVPYEEAFTKGARWVYLSSYVAYDEFSTDLVYRQIGVYTGLRRKDTTLSGKGNLLPDEVEDQGILEVLDNRKPVYRELDQREKLAVIVEF